MVLSCKLPNYVPLRVHPLSAGSIKSACGVGLVCGLRFQDSGNNQASRRVIPLTSQVPKRIEKYQVPRVLFAAKAVMLRRAKARTPLVL